MTYIPCSCHFVGRRWHLVFVVCIAIFLEVGKSFAPARTPLRVFKTGRKFRSFRTNDMPLSSSRLYEQNNEKTTDVTSLERQVMASARARLDLKRVTADLLGDETLVAEPTIEQELQQQAEASYYSPWKVALAAGGAAAAVAFGLWHSWTLSAIIWIATFLVANGDPLEEDSVAGALVRVVGRATLKSVEASQPKVRAVARAAVRGEEDLVRLQQRIEQLEKENESLKLWQKRRQYVDEALPSFTLEELKNKARQNQLAVGGTKSQLLMRLVDANVIDISS